MDKNEAFNTIMRVYQGMSVDARRVAVTKLGEVYMQFHAEMQEIKRTLDERDDAAFVARMGMLCVLAPKIFQEACGGEVAPPNK